MGTFENVNRPSVDDKVVNAVPTTTMDALATPTCDSLSTTWPAILPVLRVRENMVLLSVVVFGATTFTPLEVPVS